MSSSSLIGNHHLFEGDSPKAMQHFHRCKTASSPALLFTTSTQQQQQQQEKATSVKNFRHSEHEQAVRVKLKDKNIKSTPEKKKPFLTTVVTSSSSSSLNSCRILNEGELVNTTSQSIIFENVTLGDCLDIITDFEKYPQFLDGYYSALVERKETKQDYTVSFQSSFMFSTIEYTLQVKVLSPELIQFYSNSSNCLQNCEEPFKKHHGQWLLNDLKNGNIQATYFVNMEFPSGGASLCQQQSGIYARSAVSSNMKDWLSKKYVPSLLESFKRRIEEYGIRRKTQNGYNNNLKRHLSYQLCL